MPARKLRAVAPDEHAPTKERKTVVDATNDGTRREVLVAMRARIARTLDDTSTPAHAIARLVREVADLDREIRAIDESTEEHDGSEDGEATGRRSFDASAL